MPTAARLMTWIRQTASTRPDEAPRQRKVAMVRAARVQPGADSVGDPDAADQ